MFKQLNKTAVLTLSLAATTAFAHPGDHGEMNTVEQTSHFMSDPWHVGLALAVAVIAIALARRWLLGESR